MVSRLTIKDFSVSVSLGCSTEEQSVLQEVRFTLQFPFLEGVPGEKTDQLDQALCYAEICQLIEKTLSNKSFNLIESMAYQISEALKNTYPGQDFHLKLHKVSPPITGLIGGVFYETFHSTQ